MRSRSVIFVSLPLIVIDVPPIGFKSATPGSCRLCQRVQSSVCTRTTSHNLLSRSREPDNGVQYLNVSECMDHEALWRNIKWPSLFTTPRIKTNDWNLLCIIMGNSVGLVHSHPTFLLFVDFDREQHFSNLRKTVAGFSLGGWLAPNTVFPGSIGLTSLNVRFASDVFTQHTSNCWC